MLLLGRNKVEGWKSPEGPVFATCGLELTLPSCSKEGYVRTNKEEGPRQELDLAGTLISQDFRPPEL